MKANLDLRILSLLVCVLTGCLSIILIFALGDGYIFLLAILPLVYTILAVLCISSSFGKIKSNIGIILIAIQLFIRNVILPIFITSSEFSFANVFFDVENLYYTVFLIWKEGCFGASGVIQKVASEYFWWRNRSAGGNTNNKNPACDR